jgi:hypothetical protein
MAEKYEPYSEVQAPLLTAGAALRAVANYAEDFITRGDIDVLFTISGGAMQGDQMSADPAIWMDWVSAWRKAAPDVDDGGADHDGQIDIRHGYRALLTLLQTYTPVDKTLMSVVLADCRAVFNGDDAERAKAWTRWQAAIATGKNADISFRLHHGG